MFKVGDIVYYIDSYGKDRPGVFIIKLIGLPPPGSSGVYELSRGQQAFGKELTKLSIKTYLKLCS